MSHTKEQIMDQAQVFASGWSLVGGIFDSGNALEEAEQSKAELDEMIGDVLKQRNAFKDADEYQTRRADEAEKQRDELRLCGITCGIHGVCYSSNNGLTCGKHHDN